MPLQRQDRALRTLAARHAALALPDGLARPPRGRGKHHPVEGGLGGVADTLATLLSIVFSLNLLLCVFNLLPVPPLDGSGAIGLLFPESTARRMQGLLHQPQFALIGIVVAWLLIPRVFGPVHLAAVRMLYPEYF